MRAFIDILNEKLKESRFGLWSYKITGNVVELKVLPNMENEPHDFRLAVIQIGQVLDQLRHEYSHSLEKTQIQTFPNLMEINLVAVIQFTHSRPSRKIQPSKNGINRQKYSADLKSIKELVDKHHLKLHQTDIDLAELHPDHDNCSETDAYVLHSNSNNPFVWLKTGYFTEQIRRMKNRDQESGLDISLFYSNKVHSAIKNVKDLNGSPQAILFLKKRRGK